MATPSKSVTTCYIAVLCFADSIESGNFEIKYAPVLWIQDPVGSGTVQTGRIGNNRFAFGFSAEEGPVLYKIICNFFWKILNFKWFTVC